MFNFFKKKNKIEFYTSMPELLSANNVLPGPAREDLIAIMKKSKNTQIKTSSLKEVNIKNCPGIIQYMKNGYVIRAWQDIMIEADSSGEKYFWECPVSKKISKVSDLPRDLYEEAELGGFDQDIFYDYFPRKNTLKSVLKVNTPWYVKLPRGYGALILPVWYDNEERFTTIPGILETDYLEKLNIQLYWHALGKQEIIEAGTPLAKVIPIKLDSWEYSCRAMNREDYNKLSKFQTIYRSTFFDKWNNYKAKVNKG
jgi:hypothetical protein